jgi:hypothetical protein
MRILEREHPDIWIGEVGGHRNWSGTISDLFIGIDFSRERPLGLLKKYELYTQKIGLLKLPAPPPDTEHLDINIKRVEFHNYDDRIIVDESMASSSQSTS